MPTISVFNFVKFNFPVRYFSGAHVNCEVGGGNNISAEDAPPQPLSEVINISRNRSYLLLEYFRFPLFLVLLDLVHKMQLQLKQ